MSKTMIRSMTSGELKHFLGWFVPAVRLKGISLDGPRDLPVDLPYTVGELLDLLDRQHDDEPVLLASPHGKHGVGGFLSVNPPTLFLFQTFTSIQSN